MVTRTFEVIGFWLAVCVVTAAAAVAVHGLVLIFVWGWNLVG